MIKRLIKLFSSNEEISVFICEHCNTLRTDMEWKIKGEANCPRCSSNRVRPIYPNLWGRFAVKTRYIVKGY